MAGSVGIFLNKMRNWKFNPPSSNLWVIHIALHNDGFAGSKTDLKHDFITLYKNIKKVNDEYAKMFSTSWGVSVHEDKAGGNLEKYISALDDNTIGIFLATDVSFNANSVNIKDEQSQNNTAYSGWLSFGKTQIGRTHNHAGKIQFLRSNWDINELFIDPWIAAVGQQGLIEGDESDGIYNIKADITIMEYAASAPDKETNSWVLRKTITLVKCFPKNRDQYRYNYSTDNAGLFSPAGIDFEFENYNIRYVNFPHKELTLVDPTKHLPPLSGKKTPIAVNTNVEQGGAGMTNMYNMRNMA